MKRVILVVFVIFIVLVASFIRAQDDENLPENIGKFQKFQGFVDSEDKTAFLKSEWGDLMNGTNSSLIIKSQKSIQKLNPVFRMLLGDEFRFSWDFLLILVIWVSFVIAFYHFSNITRIIPGFENSVMLRYGLFLAGFIFISSVRIPRWLSNVIIEKIALANGWQFQVILIVVTMILFILLAQYSKTVSMILIKAGEKGSVREAISSSEDAMKKMRKIESKINN